MRRGAPISLGLVVSPSMISATVCATYPPVWRWDTVLCRGSAPLVSTRPSVQGRTLAPIAAYSKPPTRGPGDVVVDRDDVPVSSDPRQDFIGGGLVRKDRPTAANVLHLRQPHLEMTSEILDHPRQPLPPLANADLGPGTSNVVPEVGTHFGRSVAEELPVRQTRVMARRTSGVTVPSDEVNQSRRKAPALLT